MEDTQDLIFEIEGNVGSVGSSDLLGVVSLVMTGGTEALHLGKTSDSFEQQTGKKAKTVSRSLARTTFGRLETKRSCGKSIATIFRLNVLHPKISLYGLRNI